MDTLQSCLPDILDFLCGDEYVFHQYNASIRTARNLLRFFWINNRNRTTWPAQSPDLQARLQKKLKSEIDSAASGSTYLICSNNSFWNTRLKLKISKIFVTACLEESKKQTGWRDTSLNIKFKKYILVFLCLFLILFSTQKEVLVQIVPCNKSIMAKKLLSTNLERFLRRIKSPLTR